MKHAKADKLKSETLKLKHVRTAPDAAGHGGEDCTQRGAKSRELRVKHAKAETLKLLRVRAVPDAADHGDNNCAELAAGSKEQQREEERRKLGVGGVVR